MGWTVYYQVHRDKILSDAERAKLGSIIAEVGANDLTSEPFRLQYATAPRPDNAIAWGCSKLRHEDEDLTDLNYILEGLSDMRNLLDGATWHVSDDNEVVLWDAHAEAYTMDGGEPDDAPAVPVLHESAAPWIEAIGKS